MHAAISLKLVEVTADTLEKLAFIFTLPAEDPPEMDDLEVQTVRVDFNGPFCGGIELTLPAAAMAELAANMLGAEDGAILSAEQQLDALKELINVICGNLLPAIAGHAEVFNLQSPYALSAGSPAWEGPVAVGYLMLDSGPCRIRMRMDGEVPPELPGLVQKQGPS